MCWAGHPGLEPEPARDTPPRREAWEWRCFWPRDPTGPAQERLFARAARLPPLSGHDQEEVDEYLVLPGCRHNIKVRQGLLELKRFVASGRGGTELWRDKETISFPLDGPTVAELAGLLGLAPQPLPPAEAASPAELQRLLSGALPALRLVAVMKQRRRLQGPGQSRVEVARLQLPSGRHYHTLCVDAYGLAPLEACLDALGARTAGTPSSYARLLQDYCFGTC